MAGAAIDNLVFKEDFFVKISKKWLMLTLFLSKYDSKITVFKSSTNFFSELQHYNV